MLCCFGLLAFSFEPAKAQTFSEWFAQKKTLIKYLKVQIDALGVYGKDLKQGYQTAGDGLNSIGGWKDRELGLHSDYYTALDKVNPEVKAATDINRVRSEVLSILSQFSGLKSLNGLSTGERIYVAGVGKNVRGNCNRDIADLQAVLTAGEWQMTDADRIARASKVAASVREEYLFTCSFCGKVRTLVMQRKGDGRDWETLKQWYGGGDRGGR